MYVEALHQARQVFAIASLQPSKTKLQWSLLTCFTKDSSKWSNIPPSLPPSKIKPFLFPISDEQHNDAANYNFDHPEALDFDLAFEKLNELISGKDVEIPTYDFGLHKRTNITRTVKTAPIIIFEGIHANYERRFRDLMDLKIFVLTPDDIRLARRSKWLN